MFKSKYTGIGIVITILICILVGVSFADANDSKPKNNNKHSQHSQKHEEKKELAPEAYIAMDLATEAFESSPAGIGVKIAELKPKVEHIHELYNTGHKNEAIAKILGISTELVVVAYLIETFGIGELFVSSISFQNNWAIQMAQATIGVLISSKIALFLGEKVEEAAEEKLHHH